MKRKANPTWDRLARAALDARDSWRSIIPRLDKAISDPEAAQELLPQIRSLACQESERLKAALKNPE